MEPLNLSIDLITNRFVYPNDVLVGVRNLQVTKGVTYGLNLSFVSGLSGAAIVPSGLSWNISQPNRKDTPLVSLSGISGAQFGLFVGSPVLDYAINGQDEAILESDVTFSGNGTTYALASLTTVLINTATLSPQQAYYPLQGNPAGFVDSGDLATALNATGNALEAQILALNSESGSFYPNSSGAALQAEISGLQVTTISLGNSGQTFAAEAATLQAQVSGLNVASGTFYPNTNPSGFVSAVALPANPAVAFVTASGNDSTAAIGSPAKPFATWQAAYNVASAAATSPHPVLIFGGVINGAGITLTADWNQYVYLKGLNPQATKVGGINGAGAAGAYGGDNGGGTPGGNGGNGANGYTISITSDLTVNLGTVVADGGAAGSGGNNIDASANGGNAGTTAGTGGTITLTNCYIEGITSSNGGAGGFAGSESTGTFNDGIPSSGGSGGTMNLYGCVLGSDNQLNANGGVGGSAGTSPSDENPAASGGNGGNINLSVCTGFQADSITINSMGAAAGAAMGSEYNYSSNFPTAGNGGNINASYATNLVINTSPGGLTYGGESTSTYGSITLVACSFSTFVSGGTVYDVCSDGTSADTNILTGAGYNSSTGARTTNILV